LNDESLGDHDAHSGLSKYANVFNQVSHIVYDQLDAINNQIRESQEASLSIEQQIETV